MRKRAVLFTLAALELGGLALAAFFWFVMRPDLLATYGARPLPLSARVALSSWFVPATALAGGCLLLLAMLPYWRTKTQTYLAGAGLVCTVFGLFFAVYLAYAPAFEEWAR